MASSSSTSSRTVFSGQTTSAFEGFFGEALSNAMPGAIQHAIVGRGLPPRRNTIWISGEGDQAILEYDLSGRSTGRKLDVPSQFSTTATFTLNSRLKPCVTTLCAITF